MIKEAIILAGGLGTRLRSVISDIPKSLAPINGIPFLHFLIQYLEKNGIEHFIFSVGHLHEKVASFLQDSYPKLNFQLVIEPSPLGTGGAIKLATQHSKSENVLVCNGDTMFRIDVQDLAAFHLRKSAVCTLGLKPMVDFDRYGAVSIDKNQAVTAFEEKKFYKSGFINGGVYALNTTRFLKENLLERFSFEKDYLEKIVDRNKDGEPDLFGFIQDCYFIDIGIPEDYERAKREL